MRESVTIRPIGERQGSSPDRRLLLLLGHLKSDSCLRYLMR
ncbi:unnamed protein product [Callosobruchus maculatus]|uniref:Uncharacterized protein n=1 Tax=Callosobruchus maculatus TaxID=64391 RepID=A0A653D711_CALMS|nr:unnamed protein product [Callosobruchus maculatus]